MAACPQDLQDVTLAWTDPDIILCWEKKVKQGRECSLLLEYKNGKVTTTLKVGKVNSSEARTPALTSKSQAEKNKQGSGGKKKKLAKLLDYHKRLVEEKGLPPSNLMVKHAAQATSIHLPAQEPKAKDVSKFKCDKCENTFNSKWKLGKHMKNKHPHLQKPEELRETEANKSLNMSAAIEERSNTSLLVNDSLVNADMESVQELDYKKSDQELWENMLITGECGFCDFKHPVSYKTMDERLECEAYPDRGN